jgi:molybdopterin molybdotransferase
VRSVDEHLGEVLGQVQPLHALEVGLLDAHSCILAEDVFATEPLPAFDLAAVDGFAVRSADVQVLPVVLPVIGEVTPGLSTGLSVQPGLCVRIVAGSLLPSGADAVVPVEWTDAGYQQVRIDRAPPSRGFVHPAGADVAAQDLVIAAGTHLGSAQISLAAAIGRSRLRVRPRPRVVVVSTGSELVEPGTLLGPGQSFDSNSLALTAACIEAGAIAYRVGIIPDDDRRMLDTIEDQLVRADLLLTSGGVTTGSYDVVREVLSRLGPVGFHQVAMQPGMPQGFGTIGPDSVPVFALPGNPVSAMVSFEVFVRPALRRMLGAEKVLRPLVSALATTPLASPPGRRSFLRVWLEVKDGAYVVTPVSGPGAHAMAGMSRANALAIVPEAVEQVAAGMPVQVMMLERRAV